MYYVQFVALTLVSVRGGLVWKVHDTNHSSPLRLVHFLRFHLVVSSVYNLANSLDKDQTLWNFPPDLNKKILKKLVLDKYPQMMKTMKKKQLKMCPLCDIFYLY